MEGSGIVIFFAFLVFILFAALCKVEFVSKDPCFEEDDYFNDLGDFKECPLCGSTLESGYIRFDSRPFLDGSGLRNYFMVKCNKCGSHTEYYMTKEEAEFFWNEASQSGDYSKLW